MFNRTQKFVTSLSARAQAFRAKSTSAAPVPDGHVVPYQGTVQAMHWAMGGSVLGAFAYVNLAQQTKDKEKKMDYMFIHKSFGTAAAMLLVPRLAIKVLSKSPGPLADNLMKHVATASHTAMYGMLALMPLTGVAMGYYGGKGLPFFTTTLPGATGDSKDGKFAGKMFKLHKQFGWWFEMLFLAHLGGVAFHFARGEAILSRILPGLGRVKKP